MSGISGNFLPKSGGTMTGDIVLENAVSLIGRTTAAQDVSLARVRADNVTIYGDIFGWVNSSLQDGGTSLGFQQIQKRATTLADQAITIGGLLTLAHGLGAKPSMVALSLKCEFGEHGYAFEDEAYLYSGVSGSNVGAQAVVDVADTANLKIRFSSAAVQVGHKTTGAPTTITALNWRLRVRVWV